MLVCRLYSGKTAGLLLPVLRLMNFDIITFACTIAPYTTQRERERVRERERERESTEKQRGHGFCDTLVNLEASLRWLAPLIAPYTTDRRHHCGLGLRHGTVHNSVNLKAPLPWLAPLTPPYTTELTDIIALACTTRSTVRN